MGISLHPLYHECIHIIQNEGTAVTLAYALKIEVGKTTLDNKNVSLVHNCRVQTGYDITRGTFAPSMGGSSWP